VGAFFAAAFFAGAFARDGFLAGFLAVRFFRAGMDVPVWRSANIVTPTHLRKLTGLS
jgi:hypothetical protein